MLEDFAIQFLSQSEGALTLIGLGLAIVGAIIAAIVTRSNVQIARAPYFVYLALIGFVVSAVQIVWLQSIPAGRGGYLWVLIAISLAAAIAGGYFACLLAMARSRDAYIVNINGWKVTEEHRARSSNAICAWPPFQPIIWAGGTIREVYVERNGRVVGAVMVTRNECRY